MIEFTKIMQSVWQTLAEIPWQSWVLAGAIFVITMVFDFIKWNARWRD